MDVVGYAIGERFDGGGESVVVEMGDGFGSCAGGEVLAVGNETRRDNADVRGDIEDALIRARDEEFGLDKLLDCDDYTGFGLDGDGGSRIFGCFCCVFDLVCAIRVED